MILVSHNIELYVKGITAAASNLVEDDSSLFMLNVLACNTKSWGCNPLMSLRLKLAAC